jgi:glycosyltransferase involved in cell wall biosynthesis
MRILIFNFFSGVMERGIPIYCKNLRKALEMEGHQVVELCCPIWARRIPKSAQNVLFMLYEQFLMPVLSLFHSRSIYPYNTASVLGSLHPGSLLVVHDFIPNRKADKSLVARYVRLTQCVHGSLRRDVACVSTATYRVAKKLRAFSRSRRLVLPNGFWTFRAAMRGLCFPQGPQVLLCTGVGRNKDLRGALDLYAAHLAERRIPVALLGLAGDTGITQRWLAEHPEIDPTLIHVLPQLTDTEVVEAYMRSRWVWVHSRNEGYGRPIAEAKCCAKYTIATNIPPFRDQKDHTVQLYGDRPSFAKAVDVLEHIDRSTLAPQEPAEDKLLVENVRQWLKTGP